MADQNLSVRQKMINMMYLVLTALLALQVSSAIVEKFRFLNESLEHANAETIVSNNNIVASIQDKVAKSGNRDKDVAVLQKAQDVRVKTQEMLSQLDAIKQELIEKSGGKDENGSFPGGKDETITEEVMIGGGKGKAFQIKDKINNFVDYLSDMGERKGGDRFKHIALDAKDIPTVSKDPEQKNKNFADFNFGQTPMVAALAVLSQKQTEIIRGETAVLEYLAGQVGADQIRFDQIVAMVNPESKYVAAGTKYKAELFIAASSKSINPTMKVDGKGINVVNGRGQVEFTVTPGSYGPDGTVRKTFLAEITVRTPQGNDTTFSNRVEYVVAKPVIQIQSAAVSALYLNCGNELNVQVPALGNSYNPAFSVTGGTLISGGSKGLVTIVPNSKKVKLTVNSNGNLIGTQDFPVRGIPIPSLKLYQGNGEINLKTGLVASTLSTLKVVVVPDESFRQFLPKDARYKVAEWEIYLARGTRAISQKRSTNTEVSISDFRGISKPGDRIVIEIKSVKRLNFQNKVEEVAIPAGQRIVNIALN